MKLISKLLGVVAIVQLITAVQSESSSTESRYTVTGADTLRPNSPYTLVFTHHPGGAGGKPYTAEIVISSDNNDDPNRVEEPAPPPMAMPMIAKLVPEQPPTTTAVPAITPVTGTVTVNSGETKTVDLQIPNWPMGPYLLKVTITKDDKKIERLTPLSINLKTSSIFVTTDKSIFQPGQEVQYRCLIVDSELRPQEKILTRVTITDSAGNIVRIKNHTTDEYGLLNDTFQLSVKPIYGYWNIECTTLEIQQGESATASFQVKEYVLQKWNVQITPPDYIVRGDMSFEVTVSAQYTFNKGVPGVLIVNATDQQCTYYYSKCESTPVLINVTDFNGNYTATIKMGDLHLPKYVYSISITAIVIEKDTGISRNTTTSVSVTTTDEKLTMTQPPNLRPGIPHEVTIKLVKQNDRPITTANGKTVRVSYSLGLGGYQSLNTTFNSMGVATFTVNAMPDSTSLTVHAIYNSLEAYGYASVAQSLSEKYLSIDLVTKSPKIGDDVVLEVKTSVPFTGLFSLQVVGRGRVLYAISVTATSGPQTAFKLTIKATKDMSPHAKFIVFYLADCGEIVGNAMDIDIGGTLQTKVEVSDSTNNSTVKPRDPVTLTITGSGEMRVVLSSVDRSIKMMSTQNDITEPALFNALSQYDIGDQPYYTFYRPGIFRRPDWGSLDQMFKFAGLFVLTNGLYSKGSTCSRVMPFMGGGAMAKMSSMNFAQADFAPAGPPPPGGDANIQVRDFFPESLLWDYVEIGPNKTGRITFTAPDTITTWEVSAYGINKNSGVGLLMKPNNITVFKPFFLTLNLPYSIIRGETVIIPATVFNYLGKDVEANVTLLNATNGEYTFPNQAGTSITKRATTEASASRSIKVPNDSLGTASFRIEPLKAGSITINVMATTADPKAGDIVKQKIMIRPEGTTRYINNAALITVAKNQSYNNTVNLVFPANAVPGSEFAEVTVIGDFMSLFDKNMNRFVRMPYGCGEQNMITYVPQVLILSYRTSIGSITAEQIKQLVNNINIGYQTELGFRRWDGSYSAFGQSDSEGSTWLTAYVVRSFCLATSLRKYGVFVNDDEILRAKRFLAGIQNRTTGEFVEKGRLLNKALQGGSGTGCAITAYVLIAFLETKGQANSDFVTNIQLALALLEKKLKTITNLYELAIVTYALHLANSKLKDTAYDMLLKKKTDDHGLVYWKYSPLPTEDNGYYYQPPPLDVETTAYVVLIMNERNQSGDAWPSVRYLASQCNSLGGFSSTQDTVMAIQAVSTVVKPMTSGSSNVNIIVTDGAGKQFNYTITEKNKIVVNTNTISAKTGPVTITATGAGSVFLQVSYQYNVPQITPKDPSFSIKPNITTGKDGHQIKICTSFLKNDTTNMAILEVYTLSGYVINRDALPPVGVNSDVKRIDLADGDTYIAFYFNMIPTTPKNVCVQFVANIQSPVENLKPGLMRVTDYYDPSKRGEFFYTTGQQKGTPDPK